MDLAGFNDSPANEIQPLLTACLAVPRWVEEVLARRPYQSLDALVNTAGAVAPLHPAETRRAIEAHPRIGEKVAGWSRTEQSGVDDDAAERFRTANAEYEHRFGHVYLVCAAGRDGDELLADLRSRLANDPETELTVAGRELLEIALLRLRKAVTP